MANIFMVLLLMIIMSVLIFISTLINNIIRSCYKILKELEKLNKGGKENE